MEVPEQSISKYEAAWQWKDFLKISYAEMVTVDESGISVKNGAIVNKSNQQMDCSVLNKLTLLTYQYETKQEDG